MEPFPSAFDHRIIILNIKLINIPGAHFRTTDLV